MSQTRRLAAILAADVAGYSRLMGQDEAGTVRALREHRTVADPLVAGRGGRLGIGGGRLIASAILCRDNRRRLDRAATGP